MMAMQPWEDEPTSNLENLFPHPPKSPSHGE